MFARLTRGYYQAPFAEFTNLKLDYQIFYHASEKQLRPTIPNEVPAPLANLIRLCWDPNPTARPSAAQVLNELKNIQKLK